MIFTKGCKALFWWLGQPCEQRFTALLFMLVLIANRKLLQELFFSATQSAPVIFLFIYFELLL